MLIGSFIPLTLAKNGCPKIAIKNHALRHSHSHTRVHVRTRTKAQTHTLTHTHTHTHKHIHTLTPHIHTLTHTYTHSHTHTHTHTFRHKRKCARKPHANFTKFTFKWLSIKIKTFYNILKLCKAKSTLIFQT